MKIISLFISLAVVVLTGCGGGGGDATTTPANNGNETSSSTSTSTAPISAPPTVSPPNAVSSTITDANTCALPNYQSEIMATVNAARAAARSCGDQNFAATKPLTWNDKLFTAAALHSLDMAQNNYFDHNSRDGTRFSQRITAAGYSWSTAGENIAAGQPTISSVMQGWLQSPGHCKNIMNPNFKEIAVACVKGLPSSSYSKYWTMELASPR